MKRSGGFTIIQVMVILLVVGIAIWAVTEAIIDRRCADNPAAALCSNRSKAPGR